MKVLILANGDPPSAALAQRLAGEHDLILATDGAAQHAVPLGITPHLICGDFDSLDREAARRAFPAAELVATPDQNYTDLEKAVLLARERGATSITIVGATGGRIDHTFANYALLLRYGTLLPLRVVDDRSEVWAVVPGWQGRGVLSFSTQPGDTVSLIAFDAGAQVSISGVQWELREFELSPGTRGVSNRASGEAVLVEVQRGAVLVCHLHGFQGGTP